eukprot:2002967-Rhodomonas_salina.2
MQRPYPIDFRINPSCQLSSLVLKHLQKVQNQLDSEAGSSERLEEIEFYPDSMAWRYFPPEGTNTSLLDFLIQQQDRGAIARQVRLRS